MREHSGNPGLETISAALLRKYVDHMLTQEGLYIVTDTKAPAAIVPVISHHGQLRAIQPDQVLAPERFLPTARFHGPFTPWIPVADELPAERAVVLLVWANQEHPAKRVGYWLGKDKTWYAGLNKPFKLKPTHWMVLPDAPAV
jgi:hypothetical protein